ncbi:MAG: nucleoside-diphosphate sugar epimerase [Myxococcaceae bacterium]|nr:nucleoside-diphosphate sugar epimerase [Myxococcaceae bacterium]
MRFMTMSRTALIVGATGLVGHQALLALLEDESFSKIVAIVRRPTGLSHERLDERVVDFEALSRALMGQKADVALCCLGTTIRQAGSKKQFRHIDFGLVLAFAQSALAAGVQHFILVSALGADPKSRVFYNRVKGELEEALSSFGFAALTIVRPSLLLGKRAKPRLGERIGAPFAKLLPKSVRAIEGRTVGRALVKFAREPASGKRIVLSKELHELAL